MSLLINSRSEQLLTGKKRLRGTLIPCAFLKCLIAAPAAVSSWTTACPSSLVFGLMMISRSMPSFSMIRLSALRLIQRLLVLKILNLRTGDRLDNWGNKLRLFYLT